MLLAADVVSTVPCKTSFIAVGIVRLSRDLGDRARNPVGGRLDRIVGEMGVAGGGLHLVVPEQQAAAGGGVSQIVDAKILDGGALQDAVPRVVQEGEMGARLLAGERRDALASRPPAGGGCRTSGTDRHRPEVIEHGPGDAAAFKFRQTVAHAQMRLVDRQRLRRNPNALPGLPGGRQFHRLCRERRKVGQQTGSRQGNPRVAPLR